MLKKCEECGYTYSSRADVCPRCGCPNIRTMEKEYCDIQTTLHTFDMSERIRGLLIGLVLYFIYRKLTPSAFWPLGFVGLWMCLSIGTIASIFHFRVIASVVVWVLFVLFMGFITSLLHIPDIIQIGIAGAIGIASIFYLFVMPVIDYIKVAKYENRKEELYKEDESNLQYTYSNQRDDYIDVDYKENEF